MISILLAEVAALKSRIFLENHSISLQFTDSEQFLCHPPFPNLRLRESVPACLAADNKTYGSQPKNVSSELSVKLEDQNYNIYLNNQSILSFKEPSLTSVYMGLKIKDKSVKFGLGERFQSRFRLETGHYVIFNRDRPRVIDSLIDGVDGQTYGYFPMYLARNSQFKYHILQIQSQHPLKAEVKDGQVQFVFTGIKARRGIRINVYAGLDPEELLKRLHEKVGRAALPPFWSLGYHQCRWGYTSLKALETVVQNFQKNKLPIDTIWTDLDYMQNKNIFTIDQYNFPVQKFNKLLQKVHWVPLMDAGVGRSSQAYQQGILNKNFIKISNESQSPYRAEVWPGEAYFYDFINPKSQGIWKRQLKKLHQKVPFSGIWLDMNEPSNFKYQTSKKYDPESKICKESLQTMTLPLETGHFYGLKHIQVHPYFGDLINEATFNFLQQIKNQNGKLKSLPFILTRSMTYGTSMFSAHWTGDNVASFAFMRLSVSGNFLFGMFGVPMVGSDICGFNGNTYQNLCARWYQLGSLYPFARNHNQINFGDKEPYALGQTVKSAFKSSFYQRYSILRQLYSVMIGQKGVGTFFRPLFLQFPGDEMCGDEQVEETQFMIGDALMSAPILKQNQSKRRVYFPQAFYLLSGLDDSDPKAHFFDKGQSQIQVPLNAAVPLFVRNSKILFVNSPAMNTSSLDLQFTMLIFLDQNQTSAQGSIIAIKDYQNVQEVKECYQHGCHLMFSFKGGRNPTITYSYQGTSFLVPHLKVLKTIIFTPFKRLEADGFQLNSLKEEISIMIH